MTTHTAKRGDKHYYYYRCHRSVDYRRDSCKQRMDRAERAEAAMWEFVSRAMKDPGRIAVGMDAHIEQKRAAIRGGPEHETRTWLERLSEVETERRGYLRQNARGVLPDEELDEALAELEETRQMAERELEALSSRQEEVEALERDRDALMASWSAAVPEDLDRLTPEGRNGLYHRLRLEISPPAEPGGAYVVTGPFCSLEPLSS